MAPDAQFCCIRCRKAELPEAATLCLGEACSVAHVASKHATGEPQAAGVEREITQSRNHDPTAQPARYKANIMRPRSSQ